MGSKLVLDIFCEYQSQPLGLQNALPRFSWRMMNAAPCHEQIKYHIVVFEETTSLRPEKKIVWDSGEVVSSCSTGVEYQGAVLHSKTIYQWQVQIWCREGAPTATAESTFETGILFDWEWKAKWLAHPAPIYGVSPLFRKEMRLDAAPQKARMYICGLGYYILHINGRRVGNRQLEPGWTDYRKRVLYSVYDVTAYLQEGENVLCVELGEGWYGHTHDSIRLYTGGDPAWHSFPKWLMELDVRLENGQQRALYTGREDGFLCTEGPIRENSIYDGEVYDAAWDIAGWKEQEYTPSSPRWIPAIVAADTPTGSMRAQNMPPIEILRELLPKAEKTLTDGRQVVDFGENFAGWVHVTCQGPQGSRVTMKYAETLFEDGTANQENLRAAKSRDIYLLGGTGMEEYEPKFTYHGFRYVEMITEGGAEVLAVSAREVSTAVQQTGTFHCSDEVLNWLHQAVIRTERSNLHSVPTDCPQRDERQGWVNDVTVRCEETLFNFDALLFFEKWMDDLEDEQDNQTGSIPDTVPHVYGGQPAFHISSCYVLLPWMMYRFYKDERVIKNHYESIKKYVKFLYSQTHGGIIGDPYCGDWAPPADECIEGQDWGATPAKIPARLITTCYLYYDCQLMEKMAALMGKAEDVLFFQNTAAEVRKAIHVHFYNAKMGGYGSNEQGCNIFPLLLDLTEKETEQGVLDNLMNDLIQKHNYHSTTGNQMTKHLFDVLQKYGKNAEALCVLRSRAYPSFGYMMENGATTIWERWENIDGSGMNSHNHPMNAACTAWLFKAIGGIRLDMAKDEPEIVVMEPDVTLPLDFAEVGYDSLFGHIGCKWRKEGGKILVEIEVPWNMKARVLLPGIASTVKNGIHAFTVDGM